MVHSSRYCSCCWWGNLPKKNRGGRKARPQASDYGGQGLLVSRPGWPSVKLVTRPGPWQLGNLGPSTRTHEVMARAGRPPSTAPTTPSDSLLRAFPGPSPAPSWVGKLGSLPAQFSFSLPRPWLLILKVEA